METTCAVNSVATKLQAALTNYASLTDTNNAPKTRDQEDRWLRKIKRLGLLGEFSAWLFPTILFSAGFCLLWQCT